MIRMLKSWPVTSFLIGLHAIVLFAIATLFYTSHDSERQWVWFYAVIVDYPCSLVTGFLPDWGDATYTAVMLFAGTFQWGIVGIVTDSVVCYFRRKSAIPGI